MARVTVNLVSAGIQALAPSRAWMADATKLRSRLLRTRKSRSSLKRGEPCTKFKLVPPWNTRSPGSQRREATKASNTATCNVWRRSKASVDDKTRFVMPPIIYQSLDKYNSSGHRRLQEPDRPGIGVDLGLQAHWHGEFAPDVADHGAAIDGYFER